MPKMSMAAPNTGIGISVAIGSVHPIIWVTFCPHQSGSDPDILTYLTQIQNIQASCAL